MKSYVIHLILLKYHDAVFYDKIWKLVPLHKIWEGITSLYSIATYEALLSYILDMMHEQKH